MFLGACRRHHPTTARVSAALHEEKWDSATERRGWSHDDWVAKGEWRDVLEVRRGPDGAFHTKEEWRRQWGRQDEEEEEKGEEEEEEEKEEEEKEEDEKEEEEKEEWERQWAEAAVGPCPADAVRRAYGAAAGTLSRQKAWELLLTVAGVDTSMPLDDGHYESNIKEPASAAGFAPTPAGVPAAALGALFTKWCKNGQWAKAGSRIVVQCAAEAAYGIGDCAALLLADAALSLVAGAPPTRPALIATAAKQMRVRKEGEDAAAYLRRCQEAADAAGGRRLRPHPPPRAERAIAAMRDAGADPAQKEVRLAGGRAEAETVPAVVWYAARCRANDVPPTAEFLNLFRRGFGIPTGTLRADSSSAQGRR
eukprot:gene3772-5439_t